MSNVILTGLTAFFVDGHRVGCVLLGVPSVRDELFGVGKSCWGGVFD